MRKIYSILCFILLITFLGGCTRKNDHSSFFAWMDGYVALAEDEEFQIAYTCFFANGNAPFKIDDVINIQFDNLEENIYIQDFTIETQPSNIARNLSYYAIFIDINPLTQGIYKTDKMIITTLSYDTFEYPIGNWIFDIGEKETDGLIYTWDSPAVTSDGDLFPYDYQLEDPTAKIIALRVGDLLLAADNNGLELSNNLDISGFEAPINFIKPKITLDVDGEVFTAYSKGCYCGTMDTTGDFIEKSKEYMSLSK